MVRLLATPRNHFYPKQLQEKKKKKKKKKNAFTAKFFQKSNELMKTKFIQSAMLILVKSQTSEWRMLMERGGFLFFFFFFRFYSKNEDSRGNKDVIWQ